MSKNEDREVLEKKFLSVIESLTSGKPEERDLEKEIGLMARPEMASGVTKRSRIPGSRKMERRGIKASRAWVDDFERPQWLVDLKDKKVSKEELFEETINQLEKKPNRKNFRIAQMVLTELGRMEDGKQFLLEKLDPKLIAKFIPREERK